MADETLVFVVDGICYEIDLNAGHAAELRSIMTPYMEAGRRVAGSAAARRRKSNDKVSGPVAAQVRRWARQQGIAVNQRGKIHADLFLRYQEAH